PRLGGPYLCFQWIEARTNEISRQSHISGTSNSSHGFVVAPLRNPPKGAAASVRIGVERVGQHRGEFPHTLCPAATGRIDASPFSISLLIRRSANSAATRIAFLIALVFEDPCVMKQTPL